MLEDLPLPRMRDYGVRSPGHEGAGVVVKVGVLVKNWKLGDRAGVKPTWNTCMSCQLCWSGLECHCAEAVPTGLKVPGKFSVMRNKFPLFSSSISSELISIPTVLCRNLPAVYLEPS